MGETNKLKLEKKIIIKGYIELLSGLHIGGSSIGLEIGGADKVVVRNSIDNKPYIPGSSIKGKMRSLIEKYYGLVNIKPVKDKNNTVVDYKGELCTNPKENVVQFFGYPANETIGEDLVNKAAPTRFIVRDAILTQESFEKLENSKYVDMYLTEIKTETSIDRLTSKANPRSFERVPAGSEFEFEFVVDIYNVDKEEQEKKFKDILDNAIELIQYDYLGGQGTRGYGNVRFRIKEVIIKKAHNYKNNENYSKASEQDGLWIDLKKKFQ
jgi:CRISPR-associated protein Csm3